MKKIPKFKTEAEEIKFWEAHSIADYWDELEEGKDIFKRPKLTPVTLKFDPLVLKKYRCLHAKEGYHITLTSVILSPRVSKRRCFRQVDKPLRSKPHIV